RAAGAAAAVVETSLGVAQFAAAEKNDAEKHLRAAVAAGAETAEPYTLLAEIDLDRVARRGGDLDVAQLAEPRALLKQALAKDPQCFPALVDLARTYVAETDTQPGVDAVEAARKLRPAELELLQLEACLLARGGKPAAAWPLAQRSLAGADEADARQTRGCVVGGTVASIRDRLRADDAAGAKQLLAAALEAIHDPEVTSQLTPFRQALDAGQLVFDDDADPAATPTPSKRDELRAGYNEAVDLANADRTAEALAKLDALLQDCSDESACSRVKGLADQLRKRVQHNGWVKRYNEGVELLNAGKRKQAIAIFQALETEVDDAPLRERLLDMLRQLGVKPSR
ncbi:MAG TPA: hypothetical protein VJS92_11495, partial [Candidatus Polarisedimenticolaceae bacterium]|nr:hypothetical protein [Candidatus Polarisedimenticolaceae bacterium]